MPWPPAISWWKENLLERREHLRYGVRALVNFEWTDEGVLHRGRGITRDISAKGMFIYSDSEPPIKADLEVEASFRTATEGRAKLQLSARALVVRVEKSAGQGPLPGFAILNRSYRLHSGQNFVEEEDLNFETN